MAVVPVILKILADKSPGVSAALSDVRKGFSDLSALVDSGKGKFAAFTAAATFGLGSLGLSVIKQAGEFQQLQAKLLSVSRTAEEAGANYQGAVKLASASPFDVKGVVAATVSLEAFGQRSQEVLPLAGNLAAAFGVRVEEGAQVLGKAFSGSLEGFESLRSTYGISTIQLNKFGAVMSKTGGISVSTAADLAKAKEALRALIQVKYGDAMARQSNTLFGAFSNLEDSIARLAASFGEALIPLATTLTRGLTLLVEGFEKMPAPLRSFITIGGVAAAGFGALATGALALFSVVSKAAGPLALMARAFGLATGSAVTTAGAMGTVVVVSQAAGTASARSAVGVEIFARSAGQAAVATFALNTQLMQTGRMLLAMGPALAPVTAQMLALGRTGGAVAALGNGAAPALALMGQNFKGLAIPAANATAQLTASALSVNVLTKTVGLFMSVPFIPALLAIGAGAAVAFSALHNMTEENKKLDDSVVSSTRALTESTSSLRWMKRILIEVTGSQKRFVEATGDVHQIMKELAEEVKRTNPADLAKRVQQAGISLEEFGNIVKEDKAHLAKYQRQIEELTVAQAEYQKVLDAPPKIIRGGVVINQRERDQAVEAIQVIRGQIDGFRVAVARAKDTILGGGAVNDSIKATSLAYDDAGKSVQKFNAYLQAAGKFESIESLNRAIALTDGKIVEVQGKLASAKLPLGDLVALQERLVTAEDDERKIIQDYLGLLEAKDGLVKKGAAVQSSAIKETITQAEAAIEREKLLRGESWQRERNQIQTLLKEKGLSAEDQVKLQQRVATGDNEYFQRRVTTARKSFDDEQKVLQQGLEGLKNTGTASADQIADRLELIVQKTESWAAANRGIVSKSPELKAAVQDALNSTHQDLGKNNLDKQKQSVDEAISSMQEFGVEAVTTQEKLAASKKGLDDLVKVQHSGQITSTTERNRLEDAINKKLHEQLLLKTEITKEDKAQARETANVKREGLQTTIDLLKARQKVEGKDHSAEIRAAEQRQLAERIRAVREQEEAEVAAAGGTETARVEAAARREARITQIKEAETLRRIEEETKLTDVVGAEAKKQADILEGFRKNREGGPNSPLVSMAELAASSNLFGDPFSVDFGTGFQGQRRRPSSQPPRGLADFQQQVDADIRAGDRASGRGKKNPFTDQVNEAARAGQGQPAGDTINNMYLSLNGRSIDVTNPEDIRKIRSIFDTYAAEANHRGAA